jgi:hypothetical protein
MGKLTHDRPQQGGFPGTVGTNDGRQFSAVHVQVDPLQGMIAPQPHSYIDQARATGLIDVRI